jgi:hypothetical protein
VPESKVLGFKVDPFFLGLLKPSISNSNQKRILGEVPYSGRIMLAIGGAILKQRMHPTVVGRFQLIVFIHTTQLLL